MGNWKAQLTWCLRNQSRQDSYEWEVMEISGFSLQRPEQLAVYFTSAFTGPETQWISLSLTQGEGQAPGVAGREREGVVEFAARDRNLSFIAGDLLCGRDLGLSCPRSSIGVMARWESWGELGIGSKCGYRFCCWSPRPPPPPRHPGIGVWEQLD